MLLKNTKIVKGLSAARLNGKGEGSAVHGCVTGDVRRWWRRDVDASMAEGYGGQPTHTCLPPELTRNSFSRERARPIYGFVASIVRRSESPDQGTPPRVVWLISRLLASGSSI